MRESRALVRIVALLCAAISVVGCVRTQPYEYEDDSVATTALRYVISDVSVVLQQAHVMFKVDAYFRCESDSARVAYAHSFLDGWMLGAADTLDYIVSYNHYYGLGKDPSSEPQRDTLYRTSPRLDSEGDSYRFRGVTLTARGNKCFGVSYDDMGYTASMDITFSPRHFGEDDLLTVESGRITAHKGGLDYTASLSSLMAEMDGTISGWYYTPTYFAGQISIDIQSYSMTSPDHFLFEYLYSDECEILEQQYSSIKP